MGLATRRPLSLLWERPAGALVAVRQAHNAVAAAAQVHRLIDAEWPAWLRRLPDPVFTGSSPASSGRPVWSFLILGVRSESSRVYEPTQNLKAACQCSHGSLSNLNASASALVATENAAAERAAYY